MPVGKIILIAFAALAAWALPFSRASADTVLYDSSGFIQGQQSFVQAFDITTAGTLTVSLSDIPWLDTISNLNFFLTTASGTLGASMGPGTETVSVGPGMVYAHWFGDAAGTFGVGAYGIELMFQPSGTTPVPLPGTLVLLLSGLGLLFGMRYRRRFDDRVPTTV